MVVLQLNGRSLENISNRYRSKYDEEIREARAHLTGQMVNSLRSAKNTDEIWGNKLNRESVHDVLAVALSYLYSGREAEAWQFLQETWPPFDFVRVRKLIIKTRAEGILSQLGADKPRPGNRT